MIVNTKSWHFHLVQVYGPSGGVWYNYSDSCSYIKGIIKTALWLAAVTLLCSVIFAITVGNTLAWITACIMTQSWIMADGGTWITGGLISLIMLMVGSVAVLDKSRELLASKKAAAVPKTPGFFSQAYDRLHNKFCSPLKIQDDDEDYPPA